MSSTDQVVIITGASRGIGRAIALRLARPGVGLVLNHVRNVEAMGQTSEECQRLGAHVATLQADVGDPLTAPAISGLAQERFGRIDALVNNAGIVVESLLAGAEDAEIQGMVQVNVLGTVWMAREVLRTMLPRRQGCIINLSSALATRPGKGNAVYAGTKGFVESFTRALAVEVGRKGIRVNAVAPGVVRTEMTQAVRAIAEDAVTARIGLRRIGEPADVAAAVAFLLSPEAAYIHGAVLAVDGAFTGGAG